MSPDEGRIEVDGHILFDSLAGTDLKPQERGIGYLFQSYALFPNMTVRQNIEIVWRGDGDDNKDAEKNNDVNMLLTRYRIADLADRYPVQLSGGEQQRAAIARIFACKPKALLLDEPFSALDTHLRENMQAELKHIIREYDGSVILVTHSRDEAYKIADELVILDKGKPAASGPVKEIFKNPGNMRAARITGCKNISPIEKTGERRFFAKDWGIELEAASPVGENHLYAGIRAHDFAPSDTEAQNSFKIDIADVIDGPFENDIIVRAEGGSETLWWITGRDYDASGVTALRVAPESILLLEA